MFKNLSPFVLHGFSGSLDSLRERLDKVPVQALTGAQISRYGWLPIHGDSRIYASADCWLMALQIDKKVLPERVLKAEHQRACQAFVEMHHFAPSLLIRQALKERVTAKLLESAFVKTSVIHLMIDTRMRRLLVATPSQRVADTAIAALRETLGSLRVVPLARHAAAHPQSAMTRWLATHELPPDFALSDSFELASRQCLSRRVRHCHQSIDDRQLAAHLRDGLQVTQLALSWQDRCAFTLTDTMQIRGLRLEGGATGAAGLADPDGFDTALRVFFETTRLLLSAITESLSDLDRVDPPACVAPAATATATQFDLAAG